MGDDSKTNRTAIVVATIGLVGVITAAVINSSEKLFPPSNKTATTTPPQATPQATPQSSTVAANNEGIPETVRNEPKRRFFGAMHGIYINKAKDEIWVDVEGSPGFMLSRANCALMGHLVERDGYWGIVADRTDGMCEMVDQDDFGKEVGKITPVKGTLGNSGRVGSAVVNFDKAGLTDYSGIYEWKYNDLADYRSNTAAN